MKLALTSSAPLAFAAALVLSGLAPHELRAQTALPLVPDSTHAPQPARAIPPISIRISIALASEKQGKLDPAARDIYERLPARYHSIRMIEERTIEVLFGEQARITLPTGTEVRLIPIAVHGRQLHLQLEMPELLNTSMRMANSRAFYVGGVPYEQGTLVFKLVPEFSAYIEPPATERAASPETRKAKGGR
jgi:hypothetical protein